MIPGWVARYVGVPFKDKGRDLAGLDCYQLLALVYREVYGILLPTYAEDYETAADREDVARLLTAGLASDWIQVEEPREGDGVVFRLSGQPWHVGVMVDEENFLHVTEALGLSTLERRSDALWTRRVYGIFRHRSLACS